MTVAAFYSELRTAIGRSSSTDASLPLWCQDAVSEIEEARTYQWMKRIRNFPLAQGPTSNVVPVVGRVKAVEWAKLGSTENTGQYNETTTYSRDLIAVSPNQIVSFDYGTPTAFYWDEEANTIVLDARTDSANTLFCEYYALTEWPTDTSQTPAILAKKKGLVKAAAMMKAAGDLRDDRLVQIWSGTYDRMLQVAVSADTELEWRHRSGMRQAS